MSMNEQRRRGLLSKTGLGRLALTESAEEDETSPEDAAAARAPAPQGRGEGTISCTHFWRLRGQQFGKEYTGVSAGRGTFALQRRQAKNRPGDAVFA
jgi:hypothetical protein